jgi:hypothetical protein
MASREPAIRRLPDVPIPECLGHHAFCGECDGAGESAPCVFRVWCLGVRRRASEVGASPAAVLRDMGAEMVDARGGVRVWSASPAVAARINDLWPIGARDDRPGAVAFVPPNTLWVTAFPEAAPGAPALPAVARPAPIRSGVAGPKELERLRPWLAEFRREFARVANVNVREVPEEADVGEYYLLDRMPPHGRSGYVTLRVRAHTGEVSVANLRPYPRRRELSIQLPVDPEVLGVEVRAIGVGVRVVPWTTAARRWRACLRGIDNQQKVRAAAAWIASLIRRGVLLPEPPKRPGTRHDMKRMRAPAREGASST